MRQIRMGSLPENGLNTRKTAAIKRPGSRRLKFQPAARRVFSQRGTAIILQIGFPLEENFSSYSVITLPIPMVL